MMRAIWYVAVMPGERAMLGEPSRTPEEAIQSARAEIRYLEIPPDELDPARMQTERIEVLATSAKGLRIALSGYGPGDQASARRLDRLLRRLAPAQPPDPRQEAAGLAADAAQLVAATSQAADRIAAYAQERRRGGWRDADEARQVGEAVHQAALRLAEAEAILRQAAGQAAG